jgi:hypothetical protein
MPLTPIDVAHKLNAVLGLYGGADTGIPMDAGSICSPGSRSTASPETPRRVHHD